MEYCYYIRSIGDYNIPGIVTPLLNLSQEACGVPIDTVPPCPPILTVRNDCDVVDPTSVDFINNLSWTNPNETCIKTNDVFQYNVYYAENPNAAFTVIETLNGGANDTLYNHDLVFTVAGCYYVTALDSIQYNNESEPSNVICTDNCPIYFLPNVFTPDGDGVNDNLVIFGGSDVRLIRSFSVFDRWGSTLYAANNFVPNATQMGWDGTYRGKNVNPGVYVYLVEVEFVDGRVEVVSGDLLIVK